MTSSHAEHRVGLQEDATTSPVESPTEISRDFICNVTSSAWDYLAKSGQDGWLERSGDGASLGQEYGAVSGGIGCQRIAFVNE